MYAIRLFFEKNDIGMFYFVNKKLQNKILDVFMKYITELGSTVFAVCICLFLILLRLFSSNQKLWLLMSANMILGQFITQTAKRLFNRPRPWKSLGWARVVKSVSCAYSFPSGHTCSAFSIALVLSSALPTISLVLFLLATLVGISRIYLGCHYPSDVLTGSMVSLFSYFLVNIFIC